ncbi:MAG: E3 binding domain-containing protein, partial [Marinobacterium sp.]|nr:E3 binding domain-containing protein [Marinobacterium sp.]
MGHFSFKLPDPGEGIVESEIVDWHVSVGDVVAEDDLLVDVMTDKATVELSSPVAGKVVRVGCEAGEMFAVGGELVLIETEGEGNATPDTRPEPDAAVAATPALKKPESAPVEPPPKTVHNNTISHVPGRHEVLASPSVRRRALEEEIDLAVVPGTGPAGRITNTDLENFIAAGGMQAALPVNNQAMARTATTEVPIRGLRRVIAQKMVAAKRSIPHYAYVEEIDVTALEE